MIEKWDITIPELTGDEVRSAYICLPEAYTHDINRRFPVLYMFDGHNLFFDSHATYGKSWGLKEYMEYTHTPLIIVGIECNHSPDHGRLQEYSPYDFTLPKEGKITGKGKITMDWLTHTFKPYIDTHYRTLSDREHTFITGSSMGGLMSIYALLYYNQFFSRAAALSPSLWIAPNDFMQMIRRSRPLPGSILYMDYGSREMKQHRKMDQAFAQAANLLLDKNIYLNCRIVPDGEHCEASWEQQIPFFINTLMYHL